MENRLHYKVINHTVHTSAQKVLHWNDAHIETILRSQSLLSSGCDLKKSILYAKQFLNFYVGLTIEQHPISYLFLAALNCITWCKQPILSITQCPNANFESAMVVNPQFFDLYTELNFHTYCSEPIVINPKLNNGLKLNVAEAKINMLSQMRIENFYKYYWALLHSDNEDVNLAACNYMGYLSLILVRTLTRNDASITHYILGHSISDFRKLFSYDPELKLRSAPPHSNTFKEIRKFLVIGSTSTTLYLAHLLYVYIYCAPRIKELLETGCLDHLKYHGMDVLQAAMRLSEISSFDLYTVISCANWMPVFPQIAALKKVFVDYFYKEVSAGFPFSMLISPFYHCNLNRKDNKELTVLYIAAIAMLTPEATPLGGLNHFQQVWLMWFINLVREKNGVPNYAVNVDESVRLTMVRIRKMTNLNVKLEWLGSMFKDNKYLLTTDELKSLLKQMNRGKDKNEENKELTFTPVTKDELFSLNSNASASFSGRYNQAGASITNAVVSTSSSWSSNEAQASIKNDVPSTSSFRQYESTEASSKNAAASTSSFQKHNLTEAFSGLAVVPRSSSWKYRPTQTAASTSSSLKPAEAFTNYAATSNSVSEGFQSIGAFIPNPVTSTNPDGAVTSFSWRYDPMKASTSNAVASSSRIHEPIAASTSFSERHIPVNTFSKQAAEYENFAWRYYQPTASTSRETLHLPPPEPRNPQSSKNGRGIIEATFNQTSGEFKIPALMENQAGSSTTGNAKPPIRVSSRENKGQTTKYSVTDFKIVNPQTGKVSIIQNSTRKRSNSENGRDKENRPK